MNGSAIVVVSGLPRSGTSMMMRMLEAGGVELLTDAVRLPDDDNPLGYFEFERVKNLPADTGWLEQAEGKAVKVVSALLEQLPCHRRYKVIFIERDLAEVLASQRRMLRRRGRDSDAGSDERMASLFGKHLAALRTRLASRTDMQVLYVRYGDVVADPRGAARRVAEFLERPLQEGAAADAVDASLYRNRMGAEQSRTDA